MKRESETECARARALLDEASLVALPGQAADVEWLAAHLEGCPACSGFGDPLSAEIVAAVRATEAGQGGAVDRGRSSGIAGGPADDAFFAAQRAAIMDAIRAEPTRSAATSGLASNRRVASVETKAARPSRQMRADARQRQPSVVQLRSSPPTWRRYAYAFALAAGLALFVTIVNLRGPDSEELAQLETKGPAIKSEIASIESEVASDEREEEAEGGWLVASGDPFAGAVEPSLNGLSDDELEELSDFLAAEWG